jgi:enoyl-CoA hydratase
LAGRSARFDTRFLQLGLHPGGGHTWMLKRAVGAQTAAALVLFGEVLDGEGAAACGLAWRCLADDELLPAAQTLAARAASAPPELARRIKATLRTDHPDHAAAVDAELADQVWSIGQPAFAERLAALRSRISK